VRTRIQRASSQRLFLIRQEKLGEVQGLCRQYAVLGSTGNVYTVDIGRVPQCSCPDCLGGNLCKHILFVMLKVLRVAPASPLVFQKALLQTELTGIFDAADARMRRNGGSFDRAGAAVLAHADVRKSYADLTGTEGEAGSGSGSGSSEAAAAAAVAAESDDESYGGRAIDAESECPICFEAITAAEVGGGKVTFCGGGCKGNVHVACVAQWVAQARGSQVTCVLCRQPWQDGAGKQNRKKRKREGGDDEGADSPVKYSHGGYGNESVRPRRPACVMRMCAIPFTHCSVACCIACSEPRRGAGAGRQSRYQLLLALGRGLRWLRRVPAGPVLAGRRC
jgi:hypothetical protein